MVYKLAKADAVTRNPATDLNVAGEFQFDSAILPKVARRKIGQATVAGRANVFLFPNLDAVNIGYKIMRRANRADGIGPILQGISKPWLDLSQGESVAVAMVAVSL